MGNVTIALEKPDEERMRRLAKQRYNARKGSISKVVAEGLRVLEREDRREKAKARLFGMMAAAKNLGGIAVRQRGELYER